MIAVPAATRLHLGYTTSDNEDAGGATGWSIDNAQDSKNLSNVWETTFSGRSLRITIKGIDHRPTPMVTDVDVTSTPATGDTVRDRRDDPVHGDLRPGRDGHGRAGVRVLPGQFERRKLHRRQPSPDPTARPAVERLGHDDAGVQLHGVEGDMDDNGIWAGDQDRTIKLATGPRSRAR